MSGKQEKAARKEDKLAQAASRDAGTINREYTDVCIKIGQLTLQSKGIEFDLHQLFGKVEELNKEMQARQAFDAQIAAELAKKESEKVIKLDEPAPAPAPEAPTAAPVAQPEASA